METLKESFDTCYKHLDTRMYMFIYAILILHVITDNKEVGGS